MDQGVARALVTRGAVTQSVLHEWGWAASPTCQECRTEDGTPQHRYHSCEASRSTRWGSEHRTWQHQADDDCKKGEKVLLWTRGLAKDPSSEWVFKPPPEETCCKVIKAADFEWDGTISGDIYPDGSKLGHTEWAQCGWAWVTLSGGKVRVGQFGALPISLPVQRRIKRAELWAFHQALCCVLPPAVIHTDHLGIVQGLTKGKQWCNDGRRAHADIWRMVWWQLEDQGYGEGADIEVRHVKAHRSKAQKQALQDEARQHSAGNDEADHFAKLGADADCNWGREAAIVEAGAKAQWALAYLTGQHRARVGKAWEDVDSDAARPKPKCSLVVGPQHPHKLIATGGIWKCSGCGAQTARKAEARAMGWKTCVQSVVVRAAAVRPPPPAGRMQGDQVFGHRLMRTGAVTWCNICGRYADSRCAGLLVKCNGPPARTERLSRLRRGKHPITGELLGGVAAPAQVVV